MLLLPSEMSYPCIFDFLLIRLSHQSSFATTWVPAYSMSPTQHQALLSPGSPFKYPPIQQLQYPFPPNSPTDSPQPDLGFSLNLQPTHPPEPQVATEVVATREQSNVDSLIGINYQLSQILLSLDNPALGGGGLTQQASWPHERIISWQHEKLEQTFPLVSSLRGIITWFATSQLGSPSAQDQDQDPNMPCMLLIALSISLLSEICDKVMRIFRAILLHDSQQQQQDKGEGTAGARPRHEFLETGRHEAYPRMLSDATLIEFYLAQLQKVLARLQGEIRDQSHERIDGLRTSLLEFVKEFRKGV